MKGLDKMKYEIKKYDVFAQKIPINFNKFDVIPSCEGICFTIIFYILMIIFFFTNTPGDIVWRESPTISQTYMNQNTAHKINFEHNFFFFFNIYYFNNSVINPGQENPYVSIKLRIKHIDNINNNFNNNTEFDLNLCNQSYFKDYNYSLTKTDIDLIVKEKYLCPNFKGFNIYGSSSEKDTNLAQVIVLPCNNSTSKIVCKSKNEIEKYVKEEKLKIRIRYPVPIINLLNYTQPNGLILKEDYFYLQPLLDNYRFINYEFEKIQIETQKNYFYGDTENISVYEMKIVSQDTRYYDGEKEPKFFSLDFKSSFLLITHKRTYLQLLDCLSTMGGFHPILFMIFQFFHSFFAEISTLQYLMNKIFNINNPLNYQKKKKIKIDFSKYDNQSLRKKLANGSSWWKNTRRKTQLNINEMLSRSSIAKDFEMKNLNNENLIKENLIDPNCNFIDLRKNQNDNDFSLQKKPNDDELSENRNILQNKIDDPNFKQMKKEENDPDIKDYYIQALKNMKVKGKINLDHNSKTYFNWTKFFGYGKDSTSNRYKLNKLLEMIQDKIYDYFNYLNVIRCFDELALIKTLLFEKHELPLVSIMRIPIIDLGENFELNKFNLKFVNELDEKINDEDMETGIEKMTKEGKYRQIVQKILNNLKERSEEN
jgi:hypothetical protein